MIEFNEYIYGFLLFAFTIETMILIGVYLNDKKRQKMWGSLFPNFEFEDLFLLVPAFVIGVIGFIIFNLTRFDNNLYSIGLAYAVFSASIMMFYIQEKGSRKILERIDKLEKSLKPRE